MTKKEIDGFIKLYESGRRRFTKSYMKELQSYINKTYNKNYKSCFCSNLSREEHAVTFYNLIKNN